MTEETPGNISDADLDRLFIEAQQPWHVWVTDALTCPVDWNQSITSRQLPNEFGIFDPEMLAMWLNSQWANWLSDTTVECGWSETFTGVLATWDSDRGDPPEGGYRGVDVMWLALIDDEEDDAAQLRRGLELARDEIASARSSYLQRTDVGFWQELAVIGRETYPKHLSDRPRRNRSEVIAETRSDRSASTVFSEVEASLPSILWYCLDELASFGRWDLLDALPLDTQRIDFTQPGVFVGATAGAVTEVLCLEINGPSRSAHAYPVTADEAGIAGLTHGRNPGDTPPLVRFVSGWNS